MKNIVGIYWKDIKVYDDGKEHDLTSCYTEGEIFKENEKYLIIKNPETLLFGDNGDVLNHPEKKPKYYYIPRSLIEKINYYKNAE